MNSIIRVPLNTNPEQFARLQALQSAFAEVCNALAPEVKKSRVWNRVALHHLHYRTLREKFPALGSQMICNAIYAVSRASRLVFQTPGSPFNLTKLGNKALPLLQFADSCPVYFDRHTLSIKGTKLSLFTLEEQLLLFKVAKLREISLTRRLDGLYELAFWLEAAQTLSVNISNSDALEGQGLRQTQEVPAEILAARSLIPDYLSIEVAV